MAHQCTKVVQALSSMLLVAKIEALFAFMYMCFVHSLKRHLEHNKLTKIMETKGFKKIQNVKTWWVFMMAPSKCVLYEYK
jgi:ubiquinone/menaquinone biosynthesis C-methylase UbiE